MNLSNRLIASLMVKPVYNPSAERWMAVQTVGADAGAEGARFTQ